MLRSECANFFHHHRIEDLALKFLCFLGAGSNTASVATTVTTTVAQTQQALGDLRVLASPLITAQAQSAPQVPHCSCLSARGMH
jgi:hypothetical protein